MNLLVVDDAREVVESVQLNFMLLWPDAHIVAASDGQSALAALEEETFDLVLLDIGLPDQDGFSVLERIRATSNVPVVMLTARDGTDEKIRGLQGGADDYVTKPFSPREVVARVRAVLRRVPPPSPSTPGVPPLHVDERTRRATAFGVALELTKVEFDLLASLLEMPGRVYTRQQLIDRVWGDGYAITDRTIDSHIKSLRRKLGEVGAAPGLIETVRGVGYRVTDAPVASEDP